MNNAWHTCPICWMPPVGSEVLHRTNVMPIGRHHALDCPHKLKPQRTEQDEVLATFSDMLRKATSDGARKRASGLKPHWKVDPSHEAAVWSHVNKWKHGELLDGDSGAHPLVHAAWRCLAIAWQETHRAEPPFESQAQAAERRLREMRGQSVAEREKEKALRRNAIPCMCSKTYPPAEGHSLGCPMWAPLPPAISSEHDGVAKELDRRSRRRGDLY